MEDKITQLNNPEKKQTAWQIDVPHDDSCLFWAFAMAYLIPVIKNDELFKIRFVNLFGENSLNDLSAIKGLFSAYNPFLSTDNLFNNLKLNELIRETFRSRIINFMADNKGIFEPFYAPEPTSDQPNDFSNYLTQMQHTHAWGGELEIRAISWFIGCEVQLVGIDNHTKPFEQDSLHIITLSHVNAAKDKSGIKNHYVFNLEESIGNAYQEKAKTKKSVEKKFKSLQIEKESSNEITSKFLEEKNFLFRLTEARFKANVNLIKEFKQKIIELSMETNPVKQAQLIIVIYELMMQIPYKYGRANLSKGLAGSWKESKFVDRIGFPYLVKELKTCNEKDVPKILTKDLVDEIIWEFSIVADNFLKHQCQEEYIENKKKFVVYTDNLIHEINGLEYEINKMEALSYNEEQKKDLHEKIKQSNSKYQSLDEGIAFLEMDIEDNGKKYTQDEIKEIQKKVNVLGEEIKTLEINAAKLKQTPVPKKEEVEKNKKINAIIADKENKIREQFNLIRKIEYCNLRLEFDQNYKTKKSKIEHFRKLKNLSAQAKENYDKESELLSIANSKTSGDITQEIKSLGKKIINLEQEIDEKNKQIAEIQEKILSRRKGIIAEHEIENGEEKLRNLDKLRAEGNNLTKSIDKKITASLKEKKLSKEEVKKAIEEAKRSDHQLKEFSSKIAELKESLKPLLEDKLLPQWEGEVVLLRKGVQLLTDDLKAQSTQTEKYKENLKEAEKREKEAAKKLPELKENYHRKKQELESIKKELKLEECKFKQLNEFQKNYDRRHIEQLLKDFHRSLQFADTNICIISAIIDFVGWQKEYCSDEMAKKIESIIPVDYLKSFRSFRTSAMHSLDDIVRLNQTTALDTKPSLEFAKNYLLAMLNCLLMPENLIFLQMPGDTGIAPTEKFHKNDLNDATMKKIDTSLPKPPGNKDTEGKDKGLNSQEQLLVFNSSIANGKKIIEIIDQEIKKDTTSDQGLTMERITEIMGTPTTQLSDNELKLKLKYDALVQGLGEALGNLQQYTQLPDIGKLFIDIEGFENINPFIPWIKDYRSSRTHNGYYDIETFDNIITNINRLKENLLEELDKLQNHVKIVYEKMTVLKISDLDNQNLDPVECKIQ